MRGRCSSSGVNLAHQGGIGGVSGFLAELHDVPGFAGAKGLGGEGRAVRVAEGADGALDEGDLLSADRLARETARGWLDRGVRT